MGGFTLFNKHDPALIKRAESVFARMGFSKPKEFSLSGSHLLLWRKQVDVPQNWMVRPDGRGVFATGTVSYKGHSYRESLEEILNDFLSSKLNKDQLHGAFCVLLHDPPKTFVITDDAGMFGLFGDDEGTFLSSSLLATAVGCKRTPQFNPEGLLETIITGSVTAPDTLFQGVNSIDQRMGSELPKGLVFLEKSRMVHEDQHRGQPNNFEDAVDRLIDVSKRTLQDLSPLAFGRPASIGLSAGYDSRLLLILARQAGMLLAAHSWDSPRHSQEKAIAENIARQSNVPISCIPVQMWGSLSDEALAINIEDTIHYWDGRTNDTMGTFNDVHTRRVREAALGGSNFGLNGLGGEILRNPEHLRPGALNFKKWFEYFVMKPSGMAAFAQQKAKDNFFDRVGFKYNRLAGLDTKRKFDRVGARKIYRDIRLPFFAGPRLAAENRISFSAMPFTHFSLTHEAFLCSPFIGMGGGVEGTMIARLDPALASIRSCYGHSFTTIPMRARFATTAMGMIPHGIRSLYGAVHYSRIKKLKFQMPALKPISSGFQIIQDMGLPLKWDSLFADSSQRDRVLFLAAVAGSYIDKSA